MDQVALTGTGDASKKGRSQMGMKGLIGAVALCALIIWAALAIRDHLEGYQPLRVIRSGNAVERQRAAQDLSDPGREIDAETAMAALVRALGDEDAGVRARAAEALSWPREGLAHPGHRPRSHRVAHLQRWTSLSRLVYKQ
jgi:hypothetical protein